MGRGGSLFSKMAMEKGMLTWSPDPTLVDTGTRMELTKTSMTVGMTGWTGVVLSQICLKRKKEIKITFYEILILVFNVWILNFIYQLENLK